MCLTCQTCTTQSTSVVAVDKKGGITTFVEMIKVSIQFFIIKKKKVSPVKMVTNWQSLFLGQQDQVSIYPLGLVKRCVYFAHFVNIYITQWQAFGSIHCLGNPIGFYLLWAFFFTENGILSKRHCEMQVVRLGVIFDRVLIGYITVFPNWKLSNSDLR